MTSTSATAKNMTFPIAPCSRARRVESQKKLLEIRKSANESTKTRMGKRRSRRGSSVLIA